MAVHVSIGPASRRRRRRNQSPDLLREIHRLAGGKDAPAATEIYQQLQTDERFALVLPSLRTVQEIVREYIGSAAGGLWSLAEADTDDAEIVLGVLASVITATNGGKTRFTLAEAEWCARVVRAAPSISGYAAYETARQYAYRSRKGESVDDLDAFLAFAPWRSKAAADAYTEALDKRWVQGPPTILYGRENASDGSPRG